MLNLSSLNPQQRQAVEAIQGPVLILAGAGTGKTRVITYRIANLIQNGIGPGNILGVTFTNKAAREMQERVRKLLPKGRRSPEAAAEPVAETRPTICTFHSLGVRILREHIEKLGYKRNFVIYDQSDQLSAVKKILARISTHGEKPDPAEVLALIGKIRNGGSLAGVSGTPMGALAQHLQRHYESALRACNAVDFDDLILLTLRLFNEFPEALEASRRKYRHVLVDEYQDTNASQFKLVHALTCEHRNLCVVGDDDQSIYGWRGAEISNLLDMEQHFPEVKVVKLEQNYRSTTTILDAANAVISHNARRRGKKLWSQRGTGTKILLQSFSNEEEEAQAVADQINYARFSRGTPWVDHAILFRTNLQSRPLETALRHAGIRYHVIGAESFFDRREIRDLLAFLKTLANPDDDVSLLRIANVPARGLSNVTMERLLAASHERKSSVFAVMKNPAAIITLPANARARIESFVDLIERTRGELLAGPTANELSLSRWADRFLDLIGYFADVRRLEKTPEAAEARIENVRAMVRTLDHRGEGARGAVERLQEFLEEISLEGEREEEEKERDAVTLITMHSCKGLEFPHVYIVGMEEGLLPHSRSKEEGNLDEERRLFYVAVTRAMQTLSISYCGGRMKYGKIEPRHPSCFLKDLPPEHVEHADEKAKKPVAVESGKSLFAAVRAAID